MVDMGGKQMKGKFILLVAMSIVMALTPSAHALLIDLGGGDDLLY
jgi:hypothetical protein